MLYYPKIHPDENWREIECRECGEEFLADKSEVDNVICDTCIAERLIKYRECKGKERKFETVSI